MTLNSRNLILALVVVLAVGALTVYRLGSSFDSQVVSESMPAQVPPQMSPATPPASNQSSAGSIADLVGPLEQRLKKQPDDVSSWILLGKSYDYLGQTEKAQAAYLKAKELGSTDPTVNAALATAPSPAEARPLDARQMLQVGRQLEHTASPRSDAVRVGAAGAQPAKQQEQLQEAPTEGVVITGRITVAEELIGRVKPGHRLFIFAKAPDGPGMPLAVAQFQAGQLPFDYRLDNTMSMVTGQSLVSARSVQVVARVSASGEATRRVGDLMAASGTIVLGKNNKVDLVINQIVQE